MQDASGEKIKVLLVDDSTDTRENIRKLLQFEPDIEVVGAARSGREGVQLARDLKPHVVLMDINMPDMDGISATEAVMNDVPYAQIVIVSVQSDPDYMRRAMLAGARDFLPKPPASEELISTIRRLAQVGKSKQRQMAPPPPVVPTSGRGGMSLATFLPEGKIISVFSPKGGVGATVVACNLALALHTEQSRVVLVDGNLQFGNVGVVLALQAKNTVRDLVDSANDLDSELVAGVLTAHPSGIKVLLPPPRPELAEEVSADSLKRVLQFLVRDSAYVIVDTSSALSETTLGIFDVSDRIILLATPDIPSIANTRQFLDLAEALDFGPEKTLFVMNRMVKGSGITVEAIQENLKYKVSAQIPNDEKTVLNSVNQGIPFMLGDKSRPVVSGIAELSKLIRSTFSEKAEPVVDKGKPTGRTRLFGG